MRLFSSEQVSKYHPDSLCDCIGDTILTEIMKQDPQAQCGIEVMYKDDTVVLGGEVTANAKVDYEQIVRALLKSLKQPITNFINLIGEQSREINQAVVTKEGVTAGDQGIMFGHAVAGTNTGLHFAFELANQIVNDIEYEVPTGGIFKGDTKVQVTVDLDKTGIDSIHTILVSACHVEDLKLQEVRNVLKTLVKKTISRYSKCEELIDPNLDHIKFLLNPAGIWNVGGSISDCGILGRKIVANQYGGFAPVGGGSLSGKNPTKVDRSATYMARYLAKWAVKAFEVQECTVQLAYAIGVAKPMSVNVTSSVPSLDSYISKEIMKKFDLTPQGIIDKFDLCNIDYSEIGGHCHFFNQSLPWEKVID